jgi:hypothetical protein
MIQCTHIKENDRLRQNDMKVMHAHDLSEFERFLLRDFWNHLACGI